jgi:hypothetical protein
MVVQIGQASPGAAVSARFTAAATGGVVVVRQPCQLMKNVAMPLASTPSIIANAIARIIRVFST